MVGIGETGALEAHWVQQRMMRVLWSTLWEVQIQSDPTMGDRKEVDTEGLEGAEADSVLGELLVLIVAKSHS